MDWSHFKDWWRLKKWRKYRRAFDVGAESSDSLCYCDDCFNEYNVNIFLKYLDMFMNAIEIICQHVFNVSLLD